MIDYTQKNDIPRDLFALYQKYLRVMEPQNHKGLKGPAKADSLQ